MDTADITTTEITAIAEETNTTTTEILNNTDLWYRIPADKFDWDSMAADRTIWAAEIDGEWIIAETLVNNGPEALCVDFPELAEYETGITE